MHNDEEINPSEFLMSNPEPLEYLRRLLNREIYLSEIKSSYADFDKLPLSIQEIFSEAQKVREKSPVKNSHYVVRWYIEQFRDPSDKLLWTLTLPNLELKNQNPEKICAKPRFYATDEKDTFRFSQVAELIFSKYESDARNVFHIWLEAIKSTTRGETLDIPEFMKGLAQFIAFSHVRTDNFRKIVSNAHKNQISGGSDLLRIHSQYLNDEVIQETANDILSTHWEFYVSNGEAAFVSSCHPLLPHEENTGFLYTLSPQVLLITRGKEFASGGTLRVFDATDKEVSTINIQRLAEMPRKFGEYYNVSQSIFGAKRALQEIQSSFGVSTEK